MAWKTSVLVVANVTVTSDDLLAALRRLAERSPTEFTLLVPATPFGGGPNDAQSALEEALSRLREAGLEATGQVGDADPCLAVSDVWNPREYDEIVVCTLPLGSSKWLHAGLPERIARLTGAPVSHVVAHPRRPVPTTSPARDEDEHLHSLGPLLAPFAVFDHAEEQERRRRQRLG